MPPQGSAAGSGERTPDEESILNGWVRRYYALQQDDLKPWILCDSSVQGFSYVNVSVKGARNNNEDAIYADGQMFAVYDGHGGKHASLLAQKELAKHFFKATGNAADDQLVAPGNPGPPLIVDALDEAYAATQAAMPTSTGKSQAGSTGVTTWVYPGRPGGAASKIYLACLGDSQAIMFHSTTGVIPNAPTRLWDEEQATLMGPGVKTNRATVTAPHAITGALKVDKATGRAIGMRNDPLGVGFREYQLLKQRLKFPPTKVPFCISNMPGEERWRLLNLEPTRALGHRNNKEPPMRHPEIYEWEVEAADKHMLLICCDGFFSKNAFVSPEHVTRFLADPVAFCKRKDFFQGTCLEVLMSEMGESDLLPDPSQVSMAELFYQIHEAVNDKLSDDTWCDAHDSAYEYLSVFAQENPNPNIRTAPAKTLLAAAYLAVLMVSDDNISCTLVFIDGKSPYGGRRFELGNEH